ncbi:MAG: hypothetical protein ACFFBD_03430 [Candidatus Hodarchaeota archaeon]
MRFKTIILIFALVMLLLVGLVWAEDDDDQGEDYNTQGAVSPGGSAIVNGEAEDCYAVVHFDMCEFDSNKQYIQAIISQDGEEVIAKLDEAFSKAEEDGCDYANGYTNVYVSEEEPDQICEVQVDENCTLSAIGAVKRLHVWEPK